MSYRVRKAVAILGSLVFLVCYSLVAAAFLGVFLVGRSFWAELLGFLFFGLAWLPVLMGLIKWTVKKKKSA